MSPTADAESNTRVRRGPFQLDPDMAAWVTARAQALSTSEASIVRQAIRAAMNADDERQSNGQAA